MNFLKKYTLNKVSRIFYIYGTGSVVLAVILMGLLFALAEIRAFEKSAEKMRQNYVESRKNTSRFEVEKAVDYINLRRFSAEENMKKELKKSAYQVIGIMENIYEANKNKASEESIKNLIKDALRSAQPASDQNYFFIGALNGKQILYPAAPEFEGRNLLYLKDEKGNSVVKEEIETAKKSGEGFVTSYWKKPGSKNEHTAARTVFVKLFKPFNWYVGFGAFVDDVIEDTKKEVVEHIRQIRFGEEGYIFINTYDGIAVLIDSDTYKEGDNIWEMTDPDGQKVIQAEYEAAQKPEGDFIWYKWKKLTSGEIFPKVSFIKGIDEWQWMVGAGVYTDEIESVIAAEKATLNKTLTQNILGSLFILVCILFLIFFIARFISSRIKRNFDTFTDSLSQAVHKGQPMNENDYNLTELKSVSQSINNILDTRLKTEKKLKDNEAMFRTIFDNMPVMLAVLDQDLNYIRWNFEFEKLFLGNKKVMPKRYNIQGMLTKKPSNENYFLLIEKLDGTFRELELNTRQGVRNQNWALFQTDAEYLILAGYDITEIKLTQQKLTELNATKDLLFSIIAHDLRSPFTSFLGLTEILADDTNSLSETEISSFAKELNKAARVTFNLLENLLEWSSLQRGMIKPNLGPTPLKPLIEDVVEEHKEMLRNKSLELKVQIEASLIALVDKKMIQAAIRNLLTNAMKFTPKGGKISISAENNPAGKIRLCISDSGIGIPSALLPKLFVVDETKGRKGTEGEKSSGLGLMLCKQFTELNGGRIWAESTPNKGSRFFIEIPEYKEVNQN
jgi:PAS domain S-box-containing protein